MIGQWPALIRTRLGAPWVPQALLGLILLCAATLRLTGLAWDEYHHYHPDERYIAWVGTSIEAPPALATAFDPRESTFNPFYWPADAKSPGVVVPQDEPRRFAYGHLPLYAGVLAARLADWVGAGLADLLPASWRLTTDLLNGAGHTEYDHLAISGRVLTALLDVGTVALAYWLGRRLFDPAVGLLAAALLALTVMHIQLAHFWTVDPYLTFFATASLLGLAKARDDGRWLWLAAVAMGLAMGSKSAGIFLIFPLALTVFLDRARPIRARSGRLLLAGAVAFAAFALTNPFALLDNTCDVVTPAATLGPLELPARNWGNCFLENMSRQSAMVSGALDVGFARQYAGTFPFLYFIEMQLKWGMGPAFGLAALGGVVWAIVVAWRRRGDAPGMALLLAWILPFFLFTGPLFAKFMRYMQPIVPALAVLGAAALLALPRPGWRRLVVSTTLLLTGLYAVAFVSMYRQEHPWAVASRWIYAAVPPGAVVLTEQWDDPLPTGMTVADEYQSPSRYSQPELTWLTGVDEADDLAKLQDNLSALAGGDYLVLASNRIYGVVPRLPERYPLSSQFHQLLFAGKLGYDVVYVGDRGPTLGPVALRPDYFSWPGLFPPPAVSAYLADRADVTPGRADESFTVYDQSLTMIFANTGRLSADTMLNAFELGNQ
jgi:hypothetical protein